MAVRIRMLGGFDVLDELSGPVEISARKTRALLALLARRPGQVHERDVLAARLWPEAGGQQARSSLRQALKQLRRALGLEKWIVRSEGNAVVLDASVETDVVTFERLCAGNATDAHLANIYLGDFLDGFPVLTDPFEEWISFERSALREVALGGLTRLVEASVTSDRDGSLTGPAIQLALRLLATDPLQEQVHRLLMRLYLAQGRRSDAAAQYSLCRDVDYFVPDRGIATRAG